MKHTFLIIILLLISSFVTSCSSTDGLNAINALISHKSLKNDQKDIETLYKKYNDLLTDEEKAKVEQSYKEIKKAGEGDFSLKTPINYLVAKAAYQQLIPIFAKYKDKINPIDQQKILAVHNKLKIISSTIDQALEKGLVKATHDKDAADYIDTAIRIIEAFH